MTGNEGIATLKAIAPEVQILILTAFEDDEKIFRAVSAGASGYLLKTSTTSEITTVVAEVQLGGSPHDFAGRPPRAGYYWGSKSAQT